MKIKTLIFLACTLFFASCSYQQNNISLTKPNAMNGDSIIKTEQEWSTVLTKEQYRVLRQKGTEAPFTGKYNSFKENGTYVCAACGAELFTSEDKFESHCGWPSFSDAIHNKNIKTSVDSSFGMIRTEIMCARCGGHLGHVFDDGPTKTKLRYCVNSVSIEFKKP